MNPIAPTSIADTSHYELCTNGLRSKTVSPNCSRSGSGYGRLPSLYGAFLKVVVGVGHWKHSRLDAEMVEQE